jgi:hypothetical protein
MDLAAMKASAPAHLRSVVLIVIHLSRDLANLVIAVRSLARSIGI